MRIPSGLEWWTDEPGGREWLESLPSIVDACRERWSLDIGAPLEGGNVSLVLDARLPDGSRAVLKINFPDEESEHEADALRHWSGRGAVRLLGHDEASRALLLERCEPGTPLWSVEDDEAATRIAAEALRRIWSAPPPSQPFRLLADEAARWAVELPALWEAQGEPFDRTLVDEAVAACTELASEQGEQVVLHQDFHGGNVLRAEREPWLVIDPKPLVGEREFDAASLLRDRRWLLGQPGDAARLDARLGILTDELDLDRERMRRWGVAHALAWGFSDDKVEADMIWSAELLASLR
jgi:streptomycin 6-kinase